MFHHFDLTRFFMFCNMSFDYLFWCHAAVVSGAFFWEPVNAQAQY